MTSSGRIVVITVHGTGDTAVASTGEKWFQDGSVFADALKVKLAGLGFDVEIVPHLWSGANSAEAREQGAISLAKLIRNRARSGDRVHVVGHSHGGNVADEAAGILKWRGGRAAKQSLKGIVTVGTPFFKCNTTPWERWSALAFLAVTLITVLGAIALICGVAFVFNNFSFDLSFVSGSVSCRGADGKECEGLRDMRLFDLPSKKWTRFTRSGARPRLV